MESCSSSSRINKGKQKEVIDTSIFSENTSTEKKEDFELEQAIKNSKKTFSNEQKPGQSSNEKIINDEIIPLGEKEEIIEGREDILNPYLSFSENEILIDLFKKITNKFSQKYPILNSIQFTIEQISRFNTWFNNNIATIITKMLDDNESYYLVFLWIADSGEVFFFPLSPFSEKWGIYQRLKHTSLDDALQESNWLQEQLKEHNNPILLIHPCCDLDSYFHDIVCEPYVMESKLGLKEINWSREKYDKFYYINKNFNLLEDWGLRILDVIKVKKTTFNLAYYYHFGIYLGKNNQGEYEVFDLSGDNSGAKIKPINNSFLIKSLTHITVYHPIIPFKHYRQIISEIIWAKNNKFRRNEYCLGNRNCEHLANQFIFGIDYSLQVYKRPIGTRFCINDFICRDNNGKITNFGGNNNKGSFIKLIDEIKKNILLNKISDHGTRDLEMKYEEQLVRQIKLIKSNDCLIM